jgi:serine/alanine adding enzyme
MATALDEPARGTPSLVARAALPPELDDWDRHTVTPRGGNVLQSRAWAEHEAAFGWQPEFLVLSDGSRVLALRRPGGAVRLDRVYLSRGPIPGLEIETAARVAACVRWFAAAGADRLTTDSEMAGDGDYPGLLRAQGLRQVEELQPSRHRLAIDLHGVTDPEALLRSFAVDTRQRLRKSLRSDLAVEVADAKAPPDRLRRLLAEHHALVLATGERKGFRVADRERFIDWSLRAHAAGLLVYVGLHDPAGTLIAGSTFYRHGQRWTYALASDNPATRRTYPGAARHVLWEAILLALAEGRTELDLGGVDVRGARRRPRPDEPEHGMLAFKESFGAAWIELAGAHERDLPGRNPVSHLVRSLPGRLVSLRA